MSSWNSVDHLTVMGMTAYVPQVRDLLAANTIGWGSPLSDLKGIGPYMSAQIHQRSNGTVTTLDDFVQYILSLTIFDNSVDALYDLVAELVENPRGGTCISGVLAGWINRQAFNVLTDVLLEAANVYPDLAGYPLNFGQRLVCRNEGLAPRQPYVHGQSLCVADPMHLGNAPYKQRAARTCPCKTTRDVCEQSAWCEWTDNDGGGCVPRNSRYLQGHAMVDIRPFAGDYYDDMLPPYIARRHTARYVMLPDGSGSVYMPFPAAPAAPPPLPALPPLLPPWPPQQPAASAASAASAAPAASAAANDDMWDIGDDAWYNDSDDDDEPPPPPPTPRRRRQQQRTPFIERRVTRSSTNRDKRRYRRNTGR